MEQDNKQQYLITNLKTSSEALGEYIQTNGLTIDGVKEMRTQDVIDALLSPNMPFYGGFVGLDKFEEVMAIYPEFRSLFTILAEVPGTSITFELATYKPELKELSEP